ncbi:MAG: hypothetical protein V1734_01700 [Nanoarchaeota archaeon]
MSIQPYKQTTSESCLACCLLQLRNLHTGKKITKKDEIDMLFYALKFSKMDFVAGHLNWLEKRQGIKTKRIVHNKILYELVKEHCKTDMEVRKINMVLIDSMLKKNPVTLIVDSGPLYNHLYKMIPYHYPHWIIIYGKDKDNYKIYEPWEGKEAAVPEKLLKDCLKSYLNRLWGAPQLIALNQKLYI